MFVLQPKPTFKYDVSVPVPGDEDNVLKLIFKFRGVKELETFTNSFGEGKKARADLDILMEMIEGWEEVDAEFSKDNLEQLINNYPLSKVRIFEAYFKAFHEGKQKN